MPDQVGQRTVPRPTAFPFLRFNWTPLNARICQNTPRTVLNSPQGAALWIQLCRVRWDREPSPVPCVIPGAGVADGVVGLGRVRVLIILHTPDSFKEGYERRSFGFAQDDGAQNSKRSLVCHAPAVRRAMPGDLRFPTEPPCFPLQRKWPKDDRGAAGRRRRRPLRRGGEIRREGQALPLRRGRAGSPRRRAAAPVAFRP